MLLFIQKNQGLTSHLVSQNSLILLLAILLLILSTKQLKDLKDLRIRKLLNSVNAEIISITLTKMKSKSTVLTNLTVLMTIWIIVSRGITTEKRCYTLNSNFGSVKMVHHKQFANLSQQSMITLAKKLSVLLLSIQCLCLVTLKTPNRRL
jgi:hypothetical protein